ASGARVGNGSEADAGGLGRVLPQPAAGGAAVGARLAAEPRRALAGSPRARGADTGQAVSRRGSAAARLGRLRAAAAVDRVLGEPRGPPARPVPVRTPGSGVEDGTPGALTIECRRPDPSKRNLASGCRLSDR